MAYQVILTERDETIGHADARVDRRYVLHTVDTVPHATLLARSAEERLESQWRIAPRAVHTTAGMRNEYPVTIVDRGGNREYGNVIRTMRVDVVKGGQ